MPGRPLLSRCSVQCLEILDHPLVFVAGFTQLLNMLLRDVLLALRSPFEELKVRRLGVFELSLAPQLLALEVFDEVHHARCTVRTTLTLSHAQLCRPHLSYGTMDKTRVAAGRRIELFINR